MRFAPCILVITGGHATLAIIGGDNVLIIIEAGKMAAIQGPMPCTVRCRSQEGKSARCC